MLPKKLKLLLKNSIKFAGKPKKANQVGLLSKLFKSKQKDYVLFQDLHLPIFRSNEGLANNQAYLESGVEQIKTLHEFNLLDESSIILDFGCGQGRLANSLLYANSPFREYQGLDTQKVSIKWCQKYLSPQDERLHFLHLPAYNARYNTRAKALQVLPYPGAHFDLIFLNSVFSHMVSVDISFYLKEFYRVLKPGQAIYATAFVEENVAPETENPPDYHGGGHQPLTRVRYEKQFFMCLFQEAGLEIVQFSHQKIKRTGQSVIIAAKPNK